MIGFEKARMLAYDIAQACASTAIAIRDDLVLERDFGWVFFWWAATPDREGSRTLVGAAPIIVDRTSGKGRLTGSAFPAEWFADAYEALGEARFDAGEWREFILRKYAHELEP